MNILLHYLAGYIVLLLAGFSILRLAYRRDYALHGRLSLLSSALGSVYYFLLGGFPYVYLPKEWPEVNLPAPLALPAWIFLWSGLALLFICIVGLGVSASIGRGSTSLKQSGFYRYSRNPQALGCVLYGIGFSILWPSWYTLGWLVLLALMLHIMVRTEEEHLRNRFGEEYDAYRRRVPRYLGLPRNRETGQTNL